MGRLSIVMDLAMGRLDGRLTWGRLPMDLVMGRLDGPRDGKARDGLLAMGRLAMGWLGIAMDCS